MKVEKKSDKSGMVPGSLVYVGNQSPSTKVQIELIEYDEENSKRVSIDNILDCTSTLTNRSISWVNIDGVHDVELIRTVGDFFNIHPLITEDILNTTQRPKVEITDEYIFATLKMIVFDENEETFTKDQLSIILLENLVVTFQEFPGDVFNSIRERIHQNKGRIRKMGPDYLFYCLIDSVVDEYFKVIDRLEIELEQIEDKIEENKNTIQDIHWLKKELLYIRRVISPVRDFISALNRDEHPFISEKTSLYFRDVHDHCIQIYESVETIRDIVSGLIEMHLSSINNKMNSVMKYLTVFASIFIPLTFITGIYGMNFEYMPELKWQYGYFYLLGLLFFTGVTLLFIFKKKKWF
ncbi:MAG: magnesium/cobalt transporter CorA [Halobacteriovoraceae bacterium]|nr:magnesium/cobalt transporter CorA [Halobacteriovoraceae bacterium]